jgi:hypothetical protein
VYLSRDLSGLLLFGNLDGSRYLEVLLGESFNELYSPEWLCESEGRDGEYSLPLFSRFDSVSSLE